MADRPLGNNISRLEVPAANADCLSRTAGERPFSYFYLHQNMAYAMKARASTSVHHPVEMYA
jgi:hypothetical protein